MRRTLLWAVLIGLVFGALDAVVARADSAYWQTGATVRGIWFTGDNIPFKADIEGGGVLSASLSPHISAVGSAAYGFSNAYVRGSAGARFTASDVTNPNLSVGLGIQYHVSSKTALQPNEWAPDASVGVKPWPAKWPNWTLTALGWYGLQSNRGAVDAGVTYRFSL